MERLSGKILRLKREEINLSIEEISLKTKISKRIIKKIEDSDFSSMSSSQKRYIIKNTTTSTRSSILQGFKFIFF